VAANGARLVIFIPALEPQSTGGWLVAIPNAAVVTNATTAMPERQTRISKRSGFIEVLPRRDDERGVARCPPAPMHIGRPKRTTKAE